MPIDPGIYAQLKVPTFASLGEIADARAKRQEQQALTAERQSLNAERQAKLAADAKARADADAADRDIQASIAAHNGPDGVAWDDVLKDIYLKHPTQAQALEKHVQETRKAATETWTAQLTAEEKRNKLVADTLEGATEQNVAARLPRLASIDPQTFQSLRANPTQEAIDAAVTRGRSDAARAAAKKDIAESTDKAETKTLRLLSVAATPEDVQTALQFGQTHGVKTTDLGFTPDMDPATANTKAFALAGQAITPEQRQTAEDRKATAATAAADKAADNTRADAALAETIRHDKGMENRPVAGAAGSGALGGQSDIVQGYIQQLKSDAAFTPSMVPAAGGVRNAVIAELRKEGYDLSQPLTAQTRARVEFAKGVLPQVAQVQDMAKQINQMGLFGTVGGRWRRLVAGESAASALSGLTDEQKRLVGKFVTQAGLLVSGTAMVHGGARGGGSIQMVQQMEKLLDPKDKDLQTFLGNLDAASDVLGGYAVLDKTINDKGAGDQGAQTGTKKTVDELFKLYGVTK